MHGHSSHHPRAIEVHADRPILYGCGDFLNDYEGIGGYEEYEPDSRAMYFAALDAASGRLERFDIVPMQMRRFRVEHAPAADARRLVATLNRESRKLGTHVAADREGNVRLAWRERVS